MTNLDKIKSMTLEEMAEFIAEIQTNDLCLTSNTAKFIFITAWERYLESEAEKK